jgi:AAA family ATP:ADP antiporter
VAQNSRYTPFERFLTLITAVRPGEGRTVALFSAHVFLILFAYYIFRSVREGLLLEHGSAAKGSYATAVIAGTLLVLVPIYSAVRRRFDGVRLVNTVIAFFLATLVGFWVAASRGVDVGFAFYVWVGIFNVFVLAQFWALAADSFNIKTGQRLFPAIMLAAQVGALTGAEFTDAFTASLGTNNLLLVGGALLVLTVGFTGMMHRSVPAESRRVDQGDGHKAKNFFGGFSVVAGSRYLTLIAVMIILINWISSTGDFIHRDFVKGHFEAISAAGGALSTKDLITAYMGKFFFWMVVLQLFIQIVIVGRLFRTIGVAAALLVPAAFSLLGYGLVGFVPVLTIIRMVRMGEQSIEYSLTNTLRQALFLPTARSETYEGKTTIETFFWRFGDLMQAGVVFLGTSTLGMSAASFAFVNMGLAAFWLAVALAVGREYKRLAAKNLTNAAPQLARPIPHLEIWPGRRFEYYLPHDIFIDQDPGDVLTLSASGANGTQLPSWLRFDVHGHRFHGEPVGEISEELIVEIIATDNDGVSVTGLLVIRRATAID